MTYGCFFVFRDEGDTERSERERRLVNKLQTLDDKLEECERERRKVC